MKKAKKITYLHRLYYRFVRRVYRWSLRQVRKNQILMMYELQFYRKPDRVLTTINTELQDDESTISFNLMPDTYALIIPISSEEDKTRTYLIKKLRPGDHVKEKLM